tara:strand:+ start:886 stop:1185 length:300 start_codon:yes stop_codon:yes gene_type:complete
VKSIFLIKNFTKLFFNKTIPLKLKLIPLLGIIYLILPLDFLPDFIPLLGWIDDIFIIGLSIIFFLTKAFPYLNKKNDSQNHNVVEGEYKVIDDDDESIS